VITLPSLRSFAFCFVLSFAYYFLGVVMPPLAAQEGPSYLQVVNSNVIDKSTVFKLISGEFQPTPAIVFQSPKVTSYNPDPAFIAILRPCLQSYPFAVLRVYKACIQSHPSVDPSLV
jgi:hypothetical protein